MYTRSWLVDRSIGDQWGTAVGDPLGLAFRAFLIAIVAILPVLAFHRLVRKPAWVLVSAGLIAVVIAVLVGYDTVEAPWDHPAPQLLLSAAIALTVLWMSVQASSFLRQRSSKGFGWFAAGNAVLALFLVISLNSDSSLQSLRTSDPANSPSASGAPFATEVAVTMPGPREGTGKLHYSLTLGGLLVWLVGLAIPVGVWQVLEFQPRHRIFHRHFLLSQTHLLQSTVNATLILVAILVTLVVPSSLLATQRASLVFSATNELEIGTLVVLTSVLFQQAVQAYVAFVVGYDDLATLTTQRLIKDCVTESESHYVIGGYGRFGYGVVRALADHKHKLDGWITHQLLPGVSEDWLAWHGDGFTGSCADLPFLKNLIVVDEDSAKFLYVFETRGGQKLGLALFRFRESPAQATPPDAPVARWGVAPAVVGQLSTQTTEQAASLFKARVVISTLTEPRISRTLLRHYQHRFFLDDTESFRAEPASTAAPILIAAVDREMEKSYSQEMTFLSRCTLFFPGHRVAAAFAQKLFFFNSEPSLNNQILVIGRRKNLSRSIVLYWAMIERQELSCSFSETRLRLERGISILTDDYTWVSSADNDISRTRGRTRNSVVVTRRGEANIAQQQNLIRVPATASDLSLAAIEAELLRHQPRVVGVFCPDDGAKSRDVVHNTIAAVRRLHESRRLCRKPLIVVPAAFPERRDIQRALAEYDALVPPASQDFGAPEGLIDIDFENWRFIGGVVSAVDRS